MRRRAQSLRRVLIVDNLGPALLVRRKNESLSSRVRSLRWSGICEDSPLPFEEALRCTGWTLTSRFTSAME